MPAVNQTEPITYVATIEAPAGCAEVIAAGLEAAESPAALAVTLFECGHDRIEVSAHYASEPPRHRLTQLIEAAARDARLGALRIEPLPQKNWVAEAESLRGPVRAGRFLVHGRHDRGKVPAGPIHPRDRRWPCLRHRPSRHHARLPHRARPPRQAGASAQSSSISAPAPASSPSPPPGRLTQMSWRATWIQLPLPSLPRMLVPTAFSRASPWSRRRGCASGAAARQGRSAVRQHSAPPPARPRSSLLPRAPPRRDSACSPAFSTAKRGRWNRAFGRSASASNSRILLDGWTTLLLRRGSGRHRSVD